MKHLFLPYKLAVIAKEKGFDEPCLAYWLLNELKYPQEIANITSQKKCAYVTGGILAPLYQQIIFWLKDIHNIHVYPQYLPDSKKYLYFVYMDMSMRSFYNMDEAIEEAFKLITT